MPGKEVVQQSLVSVSEVEGAIPSRFNAQVMMPDGSTKVVENVRAFTKEITRYPGGEIEIETVGLHHGVKSRNPQYPFHFIWSGERAADVLCALKFNAHNVTHSFCLNYELFAFDWRVCWIFHAEEGQPDASLFFSTRDEWNENCDILTNGEEVNASLNIDRIRPANLLDVQNCLSGGVLRWANDCLRLSVRRGVMSKEDAAKQRWVEWSR